MCANEDLFVAPRVSGVGGVAWVQNFMCSQSVNMKLRVNFF